MESNMAKASHIRSTIEGLKASKRDIQAQHATLGVEISSLQPLISTLDDQIATLEDQLRGIVGVRESGSSPAEINHVYPIVKDEDNFEVHFELSRFSLMERLLTAWCSRQSKQRWDVEFYYKGNRLGPNQTPHQLEMQDGDVIAVIEHVAGCSCDWSGRRERACLEA